MAQRARVIELYKSLLKAGKDYVHGYDYFRKRLRDAFLKNKDLTDPEKIEIYIVYGEYIKKELEALHLLKKYKELKRAYNHKTRKKN